MDRAVTKSEQFRRFHDRGNLLVLANAWDAGSARLIESCGATAIATTSAGLAWARGYPDGNVLPRRVLAAAIAEITRVIGVPLTVDVEAGYSSAPAEAADTVKAVIDAGAVGINIEDGHAPPDLLCAKIAAIKTTASRAGVDLFINARTDVYLKGLVPPERALDETIARGRLYREAGCDGLFVPGLAALEGLRRIAKEIDLPLNAMVVPGLPPVDELIGAGVRRLSAGSAIAQAAYALIEGAARQLLAEHRFDAMLGASVAYGRMNALWSGVGPA